MRHSDYSMIGICSYSHTEYGEGKGSTDDRNERESKIGWQWNMHNSHLTCPLQQAMKA